ncbi:serine/threonine dehydratase [Aestuariibacter sp. AA17]|uniref:Serine/threonine dehydratase n=1 Tax=Fluctibacter corallii TaxID=2984329 RepID=A0ABT3A8M6_9ALTE|nr:serine/threonine dehydratase [Aestuariibacter sp. AA17]MCV2884671.1 serine/threonine dehydratase [Aestuariibacter sp. AA17]
MPTFNDICDAHTRISPLIHNTPIVESSLLNTWLGSRILFKAECLQKIGAFKARGALNMLGKMSEEGTLPNNIIANSSGNHAQAVAYAAAKLGKKATIYSTESISAVKAAASRFYGAELKLYPLRTQADAAVAEAAEHPDTIWIPPFNHPDIIAGQGTLAKEVFEEVDNVSALFAPCGGGGLLAGSKIAALAMSPDTKVIGAEPLNANDAARSLRVGKIVPLDGPVQTHADGAATPQVGDKTFPHLQHLDGFVEVEERAIAYWTQWLQHLLKLHIEPTSAMSMQAVVEYLRNTPKNQTVVVLLSGGNIDNQKMLNIWQEDHLSILPSL